MSKPALLGVAFSVHPDEKAWLLTELNLVRPPLYQWRRYQFIYVLRGDEIAEYSEDLGPAENFSGNQFRMPLLWQHTVGEARDMAEDKRFKDDYWRRFLDEQAQASTLIPDWLNQLEENSRIIHNRSVIGPGISKQRNGFPLKEALAHGQGA